MRILLMALAFAMAIVSGPGASQAEWRFIVTFPNSANLGPTIGNDLFQQFENLANSPGYPDDLYNMTVRLEMECDDGVREASKGALKKQFFYPDATVPNRRQAFETHTYEFVVDRCQLPDRSDDRHWPVEVNIELTTATGNIYRCYRFVDSDAAGDVGATVYGQPVRDDGGTAPVTPNDDGNVFHFLYQVLKCPNFVEYTPGVVNFYRDRYFGGPIVEKNAGSGGYDVDNDTISSMVMDPRCSVALFSKNGLRGSYAEFNRATKGVTRLSQADVGWDNDANSAYVHCIGDDSFKIYRRYYFRDGNDPSSAYALGAAGIDPSNGYTVYRATWADYGEIFDGSIGSVYVPAGCAVTLFSGENYTGQSVSYNDNMARIRAGSSGSLARLDTLYFPKDEAEKASGKWSGTWEDKVKSIVGSCRPNRG